METAMNDTGIKVIRCKNCITGENESISFKNGLLLSFEKTDQAESRLYVAPGLTDLQINGINGIDFNDTALTTANVISATGYLLSHGVTTFYPTVITNADENIIALLNTIVKACETDPLVDSCVAGIHLEGPFISPANGAKGAHDALYIKAPDWELFKKFQEAAKGRIKIVTISPEWDNAQDFIKRCVQSGVIVSIGHSIANSTQISNAVRAGASMSTHIGNGVPLILARHPNILWDQLSENDLYACIIADGIHIPDAFIKVVQKTKQRKTMIVSDATCFAGMKPGAYTRHIGGDVMLDANKRVALKDEPGILAGAAKSLLENIETLLEHNLFDLKAAWQMASVNIQNFLLHHSKDYTAPVNDLVIFTRNGSSIIIETVIKNGKIIFLKK
ncbi:MAG: amidohydrolase family protein [Agriterribacter sp.]